MRCWKPSMIPTTSHPQFRASIVAAEITEFIPGAGPPPHKIPSLTPPSFQRRGDPDKQTGAGWSLGPRSGGRPEQVYDDLRFSRVMMPGCSPSVGSAIVVISLSQCCCNTGRLARGTGTFGGVLAALNRAEWVVADSSRKPRLGLDTAAVVCRGGRSRAGRSR
jgi:hypothetical protein